MTSMFYRVATTQRQLDDALRIRWSVFGAELGLLGNAQPPAPREVNCFDTLDTTVHLVVYAGDEPVATSRLLLPNREVARATGGRLGVDLERRLDLSALDGPGLVFAETTRLCILKSWRNSEAILWLQAGLYHESHRRGVTHWIASANMETDAAEDAGLVSQMVLQRGLRSAHWHAQARGPQSPPSIASAPLYSDEERASARQGRLEGLRLPRILSFLARKMGARFMAEPLYDAGFRRFSLPLVAALDEVPPRTRAHFAALHARES